MKKVLFILVLLSIFLYTYDYLPIFENQSSNEEQLDSNAIPEAVNQDDDKNVLNAIGKSSEELMSVWGEPDRIDPSSYDYDWWIYKKDASHYMQVGISNNRVVTAFVIGPKVNMGPFVLGQTRQETLKQLSVSSEVSFSYDGNHYRFELTDDDQVVRPLVKYDDLFVQLYFDKFTDRLSSVRAVDAPTLIKLRPYELSYRGELLNPEPLSEDQWKDVEDGNAQQILDITNVIRQTHRLSKLSWDQNTADVAYGHSKDMSMNNYFDHVSPTAGDLAKRLEKGEITYLTAGENIAAQYQDGAAAVEGWLNSEGHRKALLNKNFNKLGVGVYQKYYTQNFVQTMSRQK
ncbi:hypothetical protein AMD01_02435 [Priestia koreensis]|uniref:Uncharacterized protein n=1 Tax=Priestia koreensis TaxID=284581 RepID=A0A0M0LHR7_9BACI|nr:hypothetical protein AMD01_02435 [Priestia koreensis]